MRYKKRLKNVRPSHFAVVVFIAVVIASVLLSFGLVFATEKRVENITSSRPTINHVVNNDVDVKTVAEKPTPTIDVTNSPVATPTPNKPWGVAQQISDTTWTMKVGEDEKMATPQEVFDALNNYRSAKGRGTLAWDQKLADFAQKRAETFLSIKGLDSHSGFNEFFKNDENYKNIGFYGVGENSSYGFKMEGVHLIEWIFAGDPPHENNQLDPSWTHVGIGVAGTGVDLVFGKNKM